MNTQRGVLLSIWILVNALAILCVSLFLILVPGVRSLVGNLPGWFPFYVALLALGRFLALIGIWNFKRWGVYIFLLLGLVEVIVGIFVFTLVQTLGLRLGIALPAYLILLVIWILVSKPKWQLFR